MQQLRLFIRGRVQGVAFRASAQREALRLGVVGWVRNLDDGSVELLAEGDEASLDALLDWCRKGPPGARVTEVEADRQPAEGGLAGFRIAF